MKLLLSDFLLKYFRASDISIFIKEMNAANPPISHRIDVAKSGGMNTRGVKSNGGRTYQSIFWLSKDCFLIITMMFSI